MHDLVIRAGTIVDGTRRPGFTGDVAVDSGRLTQVGGFAGTARREIDAHGSLVTPGFVDLHTHYDAQVTWDALVSSPTTFLAWWGRDRRYGPTLPVESLVRRQTRDTARLAGFADRGVLEPGRRADLNVIDWSRLGVCRPELVDDLPAGGRRLVQRATGYRATIVAGEPVFLDGEHTGALPGRVVRRRS